MEQITKKDPTTYKIFSEIYTAIEKLGGKSDLLGIIGSYGDTMTDGDVLEALISLNHSKVEG